VPTVACAILKNDLQTMPKSFVCRMPNSGGRALPVKRTWIPRGIGLEQASHLCNSSLDGSLSDFSSLAEVQEALYIMNSSGLTASLVDRLWVPYRRNGSSNDFLNIYSGQLFNASMWMSNQPGANRDCVACEENGCHSENCQA
jgi:hypothetical protein